MSDPLYKKVHDTIVQRIAAAQYVPGSMLPSEIDFAAELSVSQGTVRKALIELEQKGIVQRRQGKGTFVTLRTPENSLFRFFSVRTADDQQVAPKLKNQSVSLRSARAYEKKTLFGNPDKVLEINRIRTFNGKPLCHEISIVSSSLFPGLRDRSPLPNELYVLYQQAYSCIIISAEENLKADILEATIASELEKPVGTPVIVASRKAYDLLDRVVELREMTILTDEVTYSVKLD